MPTAGPRRIQNGKSHGKEQQADRRAPLETGAAGAADAVARRRASLRIGVHLRHEGEQGHLTAVAAFDLRRRTAATHHGWRKGWGTSLVPGRQPHRLRRQARGRRRAAGLPDRARRRRGRAAHLLSHRRVRDQVVSRWPQPRLHLVGMARNPWRKGARQALQGAQGQQGQGARCRACAVPLLGPLAHRRARAAPVHGGREVAQGARLVRRHEVRIAAGRHERQPLRHRSGRAGDRVRVRSGAGEAARPRAPPHRARHGDEALSRAHREVAVRP